MQLIKGATYLVTRETANSPQPEIISPDYWGNRGVNSTKEQNRLEQEGMKSGRYVHRTINPRGTIPIKYRFTKVEDDGAKVTVKDGVVESNDLNSRSGDQRYVRFIGGCFCKPGKYEIAVQTLQDSPPFEGIDTRVGITFPQNTIVLD